MRKTTPVHKVCCNLFTLSILVWIFNLLICSEAQKTAGVKQDSPSKAKVTTSSEWIEGSLNAHNYFRSLHDTPPLVLNDTLSEISQYYANYLLKLAIQNQGSGRVYFDHNPEAGRARIGENLYYSTMPSIGIPLPPSYAVLLWYEEIKDYNFTSAKRKQTSDQQAKIGHLTQLLWSSTLQMGTAYASATLKNNQTIAFVVANYYKQGNLILRDDESKLYLENVLSPTVSDADINAAIVKTDVKSWLKALQKSTANTNETPEKWRKTALMKHNKYRSRFGVEHLRLNSDLCKVSQMWADYLLEKGLQTFNAYGVLNQIESNFIGTQFLRLGESSLFYVTGTNEVSPEGPARIWYSGRRFYQSSQQSKKSVDLQADRFIQLIWKSTTEFCVSYASGVAVNGQNLIYVVANYYPGVNGNKADRMHNIHWNDDNTKFSELIIEEDIDDDDDGCCSFGTILLIILGIAAVLILMVVGSIFLLSVFKKSWYESIVRTFKR
ncbi:Golgi-associated plant pathogenesis-related protein 1 [Orchesella cincta]|uniref:Golgi-associated plant pathogenesis-related protein 1 n=1 Tax=Orchesella cincta TaxID=48709 RepID=A0A1D2MDC0_ORCCI|nr:Golgi-associated plant pathogenesis-related protein 1 [Orchesella cincta]